MTDETMTSVDTDPTPDQPVPDDLGDHMIGGPSSPDAGAEAAGDDVASDAEATTDEDGSDGEADEPIDWEERADQDRRTRPELLEALVGAEVERDGYLDQLRRKQAEFDNFRKRMAKDAQRQRVVGQEAVVRPLLDVIDDFDRTVAALEADEAARKGVELVREKLVLALASQGLVQMDAEGAPFDPTRHEAVQQVEGDGDEPTVSQVLRTGWTMHDRVLRPAMVVVAQ